MERKARDGWYAEFVDLGSLYHRHCASSFMLELFSKISVGSLPNKRPPPLPCVQPMSIKAKNSAVNIRLVIAVMGNISVLFSKLIHAPRRHVGVEVGGEIRHVGGRQASAEKTCGKHTGLEIADGPIKIECHERNIGRWCDR